MKTNNIQSFLRSSYDYYIKDEKEIITQLNENRILLDILEDCLMLVKHNIIKDSSLTFIKAHKKPDYLILNVQINRQTPFRLINSTIERIESHFKSYNIITHKDVQKTNTRKANIHIQVEQDKKKILEINLKDPILQTIGE